MRSLVFLLVSFLVAPAFSAIDSSGQIECRKDGDIFKAGFYTDRNVPIMFGLEVLKGGGEQPKLMEAYETFWSILESSLKCEDLSPSIARGNRISSHGKVFVPKGELFICDKEMFAPKGVVYGQIFLSFGAISVFKDSVAPAAGWSCDLLLLL